MPIYYEPQITGVTVRALLEADKRPLSLWHRMLIYFRIL